MTKANDVADLLGEDTPKTDKPAKKVAAKKAAPVAEAKPAAKKVAAKPAAAPAKKAAAPKAEKAPKEKAAKEPITFEEGERDALYKRIKQIVKTKSINSRDLAAKLEISTRKLRPVLYSLQGQGAVTLELGSSKVAGMTVSPA